jgi:ATP-dependent DNA helicase RecQ
MQETQAPPDLEPDFQQALKRLGYDAFRPGQQEAVQTLLEKRRLLLIAPTGGGKSLCYQLPASLLAGTTLVVSPLIALMHDQVEALERRGVAATFLASTLDGGEIKRRMAALGRGAYKLVYVAPERLAYEGFRGLMQDLDVPLIAIDEAHCISEWGHDFRPEYMKIGELLANFAHTRVLACTATATPVVRDEILTRLGLPGDTPQIVRGFARPNLALCVRDTQGAKDRHALCDELLAKALGGAGAGRGTAIVYAPTRKRTEEEVVRLQKMGWKVKAYHAGLSGEVRARTLTDFMADKIEVVVATNAFGMGIDRSDVRAVVHLAPPGSIEAYYQEVGRAGRDGAPAWGLLLTCPSDMPLRRSLLERSAPGQTTVPAVVEHKWNLFLELMRWAEGGSCRHDAILRYFGDEQETLQGCGQCDVCDLLADPSGAQDPQSVTLVVRQALSAVARIHGRFGLKAAVQLLRGAADPRIERAGLDRTRTFGILKEHTEPWLLALLRRCVTAGWVDFVAATNRWRCSPSRAPR